MKLIRYCFSNNQGKERHIYIYGCIKVTGHFSENIFFSRNFYRDKHVMHVHAYATLHK